ncbi:MAG: hypothetical protein KC684_01880 [Candidatus Omnitrophica bacterium]|nr:hypothetical protein [Candidatus Omnitrophota bacterium]
MYSNIKLFGAILKQSWVFCQKNGLSLAGIPFFYYLFNYFVIKGYWNNDVLQFRIVSMRPAGLYLFLDAVVMSFMVAATVGYLTALVKKVVFIESKGSSVVTGGFVDTLFVTVLYVLKTVMWSVLLIIPGLIYAAVHAFGMMSCAVDGYQRQDALSYSKKLIKPNIHTFLDMTLFLGILVWIGVFSFIKTLDVMMYSVHSLGYMWLAKGFDMMGVAVVLGASVFVTVFYYYLYLQFKSRTNNINKE